MPWGGGAGGPPYYEMLTIGSDGDMIDDVRRCYESISCKDK